jgi:hypothetical protein
MANSANSVLSALSSHSTTAISRRTSTSRSTPSVRPSPSLGAYDPRLLDMSVKLESQDIPPLQSPNLPSLPRSQSSGLQFGAMGLRGTSMRSPYFSARHDNSFHRQNFVPSSTYGYREPLRTHAYLDSPPTSANATIPSKLSRSPRYSEDENDLPKPSEQPVDNSKLKGILWPGMSIFDSATPMARRRRNQKKDGSILEQLENNSLDVVPTEQVWTPGGSLKRSKDISGLPSSSSPPGSPSRPLPFRRPLNDVESRLPWNEKPQGLDFMSFQDDRLDDALTFGTYDGQERKRKRSFQIWHDDSTNESTAVHLGPNHGQLGYMARSGRNIREDRNAFLLNDRHRAINSMVRNEPIYKSDENSYDKTSVTATARFRDLKSYGSPIDNHHDANMSSNTNFANLIAAAEGASADRTFLSDPFFMSTTQAQPFGTTYNSSHVLASGNTIASRNISNGNRRHHPSLSIEALLIGGCPTSATDSNDVHTSLGHGHGHDHGQAHIQAHTHAHGHTHGHAQNQAYGFTPSHTFGFGMPMASPIRAHTPPQDWTTLWQGMTSTTPGRGFWSNQEEFVGPNETPKGCNEEEDNKSVPNHILGSRSLMTEGEVPAPGVENPCPNLQKGPDASHDPVELEDDGRTLSAPQSTPNH